MTHPTRRGVIAGGSSLAALSAGGAFAQGAPASPVMLNIIDVAGNLQLTQASIEKFARDNPKLISRLNFSRAPSPELPAKLKAQQDANRVDIDMVLTGPGRDVGRDPAGAVGRRLEVAHREPAQGRGDLPRAGADDAAQFRPERRRRRRLFAVRPAVRIHGRQAQDGAEDGRGVPRLCEGEPQPLHLCPPAQFRARLDLSAGHALHPRRQRSDRPDERLGQDLGLSQGTRHGDRLLPHRHRRDDEGARRRHARLHRLDAGLGTSIRARSASCRRRRRSSPSPTRIGSPTPSSCAFRRA
jgi:hypothetical protein